MTMSEVLRLLNEFWVLLAALGVALGWIAKDLLRSKFVTHTFCQKCRGALETRQTDLDAKHDALEARQYSQELALTALGTRLDTLPTAETVNSLNVNLTKLVGSVETLGEKINGQANGLRRQEELLGTILASYVEARHG